MSSAVNETVAYKPYDSKAVTRKQASAYSAFGWVLSKERPVVQKKKKNSPEVVIRRKFGFAENPALTNRENEYLKLEKKKYRQLPILGIITFILMVAFFVVAAFELGYGIADIVEKTKADDETATSVAKIVAADEEEEETSIKDTIKEYADPIKDDYLSYINNLFEGKTNEETGEYENGIVDTLQENVPDMADYLTSEMIVGVIALILCILCMIFFSEIAKKKKRRRKKFARMAILRRESEEIVADMRKADLSLMNKTERKNYTMQLILTTAIRDALAGHGQNANVIDEDDDF